MFAGRVGIELTIDSLGEDSLAALFSEELGAVIQVSDDHYDAVVAQLTRAGLGDFSARLPRQNGPEDEAKGVRTAGESRQTWRGPRSAG